MTLRELIVDADRHAPLVLGALAALPAGSFLLGRLHEAGRGGDDPWRRLYAALVYAACIPGMFSASLIVYAFLFTGENLLDANVLVYFAPLVSMAVSLATMSRNVDFDQVPGFDRIWGLLGLLLLSFFSALFLQRLRINIIFLGGLSSLWLLALVVFVVFRLSLRKMLGPGNPARP